MRRRWPIAATAVVGLVAVGSVGYTSLTSSDADEGGTRSDVRTGSAQVTKSDMVVYDVLEGQLGYPGKQSVISQTGGTVTQVRAPGTVVTRGERLVSVDRVPICLMYGHLPAYRDLTVGTEGPDVEQFERNLAALGYTGFTVDDEYTSYTAAAVKEWQEDWELEETGEVTFGSVFYARGPVRIAKLDVAKGGAVGAGQTVISVSRNKQIVDVEVPVTKLSMVKGKPKVTVTLPDGTQVNGRVVSISAVVETSGEDEDEESTVAVTVRLDKQPKKGQLEQTPVDVRVESERRRGVLSVPVNALVANPEGGYAVVAIIDGQRRTIPVQTGVFSDGRVEVTGKGLRAGTMVEVPAE